MFVATNELERRSLGALLLRIFLVSAGVATRRSYHLLHETPKTLDISKISVLLYMYLALHEMKVGMSLLLHGGEQITKVEDG